MAENSSPDRAKAADNPAQGVTPSRTPSRTPTPAWNTRPASIAALGDSITRGFDACGLLKDCPDQSWVTALVKRLSARGSNLARSGAWMADLAGQAEQAVARRPDQVVILMGANDACRGTVARNRR